MKAVLINGAQKMLGVAQGGVSNPYDNIQNFGRISLVNSTYISEGTEGINFQIWDNETIYSGESKIYSVPILDPSTFRTNELRATLVWTDPPALPFCKKCVLNRIDLSVNKAGDTTIFYPNGLNEPDKLNNAQRVIVEQVAVGEVYNIIIHGMNLAIQPQRFSLVVSGCIPLPTEKLKNWTKQGDILGDTWFPALIALTVLGFLMLIIGCFYQYTRYRHIE